MVYHLQGCLAYDQREVYKKGTNNPIKVGTKSHSFLRQIPHPVSQAESVMHSKTVSPREFHPSYIKGEKYTEKQLCNRAKSLLPVLGMSCLKKCVR